MPKSNSDWFQVVLKYHQMRVFGRIILFILFFALSAASSYFLLKNNFFVSRFAKNEEPQPIPDELLPTIRKDKVYAPILMYHHIALKRPQDSYYVSPEIFEEQMQWLSDNNYKVISLDDFYQGMLGKKELPQKPVVITFDDGVDDQYINAFPILKKFGYTATFFIKLNNVGPDKGGMTYTMLRNLKKAGMTIGSHSMNHDNMANMSKSQLDYELDQSKKILESQLKTTVNYFSYPGGAYSDQTISETQKAGYLAATTTHHDVYHQIKTKNDLYKISRIHIDDEMPSFENWIQGINLK